MNKIYMLAIAIAVTTFSCKKKEDPAPSDQSLVVENYANVVYATYEDSWIAAKNLRAKAAAFVADPSEAGLEDVRAAYIASRTPYIQSEAFRFYSGPIDDDRGLEGSLNSWPLDEAYIDYVAGNANAGIINDLGGFPAINADVIAANNQTEGEESVSCGYHAVEFLLWGQDFSETGPGDRKYTDYVTGNEGTHLNQARRAQYLLACIDLIIDNLETLVNEWKPGGSSNYRAGFVGDPNASIANFLNGAFRYADGELSVERMLVALDAEDDADRQENEQSCFSDQTYNDIILGQKGIKNVYVGEYVRIDGSIVKGTSLSELVHAADPATDSTVRAKIYDADVTISAIHAPFDNEIVSSNTAGRIRVQNAINALHTEAAQYQKAGAKLGMIIN